LEIFSYSWVGIFIDTKSGGSMLKKNLQKTDPDFFDFRNGFFDLIGNQMEALWIILKAKAFLEENAHESNFPNLILQSSDSVNRDFHHISSL
jgi:hypothetical protein